MSAFKEFIQLMQKLIKLLTDGTIEVITGLMAIVFSLVIIALAIFVPVSPAIAIMYMMGVFN